MEFKETQAIYLQIGDYLCDRILQGRWKESERIPSVRELGAMLEVNPNTVMRTYDFLQDREIIFNKRGIGYFVSNDARPNIIRYRKKQFLEEDLPQIFKNMTLMGMTFKDLENEYNKYPKENENK
jgi:DNA-binding transcriptional regulator YhcF (GntR family)